MESFGDSGLTFARPLEQSDWIRFFKYSKLVKRFSLINGQPIAPETFYVINATRPAWDLFPALKYLTSRRPPPLIYDWILHRDLQHFDVETWGPPVRLLQSIRSMAPSLKKLALGDETMKLDPLTHSELMVLIPELTSLTHITLPSSFLTSDIFEGLSRAPKLQSLRVAMSGDPSIRDAVHGYDFRFSPHAFSSLERLSMEDCSIDPTKHLFLDTETTKYPKVDHLEIGLCGHSGPTCLGKYFDTLSRGFFAVEDLIINASISVDDNGISDPLVAFSMIQPLLSLSRIQHFHFKNEFPIALRDSHIEQMARSWPELDAFVFLSKIAHSQGQTQVTLSSLISWAKYCPRLSWLSYAIDASLDPPLPPTDDIVFSNPHFYLDIPISPIGDTREVSLYIADLLPPLGRADVDFDRSGDPTLEPWEERWTETTALVDGIQKVKARALRRALITK
ncbi:hypothetical protein SISNIDRAFT_487927 [Sistotremastrum niveocremeum HHB9708]|uniref:F-box domain-containing protein n=2 Tax=Sistotremastraceae TaxID=3402574 RepID=A0A164RUZ5_9AGAM|nr:hypothetical protein SISNIDRAFT_487927 [Sistotremastrum niveocremeum HHB9708]KZT38730.1 hypothetical protein SISSUDRAFT_1061766 [Sistotremastrum suecicum HHB10207 ss-3]